MLSDFWAKNYTAIKTANAKLPILLRESNGTVAKLTATYGAQTPFFSDMPCVPPLVCSCAHEHADPRAPPAEFGVEKTVDVEGFTADAFGGELATLMKGS